MRLNSDNTRKLIKALRSGDYEQTMGTLCYTDGGTGNPEFCVWGVVCAESGLGHFKDDGLFCVEGDEDSPGFYDQAPPGAVEEWLGMPFEGDVFDGASLYELNDAGWTFAELADLLERRLAEQEAAS